MSRYSRRSEGLQGQNTRVSLVPGPAQENDVRPASREETFPVAIGALLLALTALIVCVSRGYLLLYGDAVAHLAIARRIFDSRNPGLAQLGGVWLPFPHLLMLPFVQRMDWWQNGMAGAWPSLLCYVLSTVGVYRLARWLMVPRWAFVATLFYAINPNLLYASTTALTESLFLALLVWITLLTVETLSALEKRDARAVNKSLFCLAVLIAAAVFTRYDGWIVGCVVWCAVAWQIFRRRELWPRVGLWFGVFTLLILAAPAIWLAYNQHFYHDPFDFLRGPYSAAAIERKTSPRGSHHYRGWHNPAWALLFYTRTAQVDAAVWDTGFLLLAASLAGLFVALRRRLVLASVLLWLPLPFYVYSIAYGSVPIFIPQLWPHAYYNARYGMEMLPALVLFSVVLGERLEARLADRRPLASRLLHPIVISLIILNALGMMYETPLVLKEGIVNATTRVAFETALAAQLREFPPLVPILMYNSDHVGALQQAGIPLRRTLNEGDYDSWQAALRSPAEHAAYIVAIAGDQVSQAVVQHPAGLTELTVLCTTGQPCARIYKSNRFRP